MAKFRWPWSRDKSHETEKNELGLKDVLESVTGEIIARQKSIEDGSKNSIFYIEKAKVSINFVAKKSGTGSVNLYALEAGGSYTSERTHHIELELSTVSPLFKFLIPHLKISTDKLDGKFDEIIDELLRDVSQEEFLKGFKQLSGE